MGALSGPHALSHLQSGHAVPFPPQDFCSPCVFVYCSHNTGSCGPGSASEFQLYELELTYFQGVATPKIYAMITVGLCKTPFLFILYFLSSLIPTPIHLPSHAGISVNFLLRILCVFPRLNLTLLTELRPPCPCCHTSMSFAGSCCCCSRIPSTDLRHLAAGHAAMNSPARVLSGIFMSLSEMIARQ